MQNNIDNQSQQLYQNQKQVNQISSSSTRRTICDKKPAQFQSQQQQSNSFMQNNFDSQMNQNNGCRPQQQLNKIYSSSKENHSLKNNTQNYLTLFNSNNTLQSQNIPSSQKGNNSKVMKAQVTCSISANLLKQSSQELSQQNLQLQHQPQQVSYTQQRKLSASNITRPQKFSISIQNKDQSSSTQQEIMSDDRDFNQHAKKKPHQIDNNINPSTNIQSQLQNQNSNNQQLQQGSLNINTSKSFANQQQASTISYINIQNNQKTSQIANNKNTNPHTKNITKDLINYKILQITSNNNKLQNNGHLQNNISSNSQTINQSQFQCENNKSAQYNQSISSRSSQQLVITNPRRTESTSIQNKQKEKSNIEQYKTQESQNQEQTNTLIEQQKSNCYENISVERYESQQSMNQPSNLQQFSQNVNKFQSLNQITQNNNNFTANNIINQNTNINQQQLSFLNNNHLQYEKNFIQPQPQICNYNSSTFNSTHINSFPINSTSNYSSFGTLPKGIANTIFKQQNPQNTLNCQSNTTQQNPYLPQQLNNESNRHAYSKNNEMEISSVTNLILTDQDILKDLINNRGSTKNIQKSANNYFSSHQNRLQQALNSKNLVEQQNIIKDMNAIAMMSKSPEVLNLECNQAKQQESYQQQQQQQQQYQQQQQQQQQSIQCNLQNQISVQDYSDDDDVPVVPHNHTLMQQKYSKRVGISVSAVPDLSKLSSLLNKNGIKRVGVDMQVSKQILELKKNQTNFNQSNNIDNFSNIQPIQQPSKPTSTKNKQSHLSNHAFLQVQKNLKQQNKEDIILRQIKESQFSSLQNQIQQNIGQSNNQTTSSTNNIITSQTNQIGQAQKKSSENKQKSRLHQQKIKSFYQQNSQNQYYLVNPNQRTKNSINQNLIVPVSSQNSSQSQTNSNYNLNHQSLQKDEELFNNKSDRLMYNNFLSNVGSTCNTVTQPDEKPGFQSERFNYIQNQQVIQIQNSNLKENENLHNKIPLQSHLKIAQQLSQQHQKIQTHSSFINEPAQQNQITKQKQVNQNNFVDGMTNNYYFPQQNLNDTQNNHFSHTLPQNSLNKHNQSNLQIQNNINIKINQSSQIMNNTNTEANMSIVNKNQDNDTNLNINENKNINEVMNQNHTSSIIIQNEQLNNQNSNFSKIQALYQSQQNGIKSHLKINPTPNSTTTFVGNINKQLNNGYTVPYGNSTNQFHNINLNQNYETMNNTTVSPNVPSNTQDINKIISPSIISTNGSNNRNVSEKLYTGGCNVSQNATTQSTGLSINSGNKLINSNQPQNHNKNLLSTARKSETTQYSNFSSDSPLVCNENLSGLLTNRFEDNSQFKNYFTSKSNNISNNNIIPPNSNLTYSANQQPNISNSIQPLYEIAEKKNHSIQQNCVSESQNQILSQKIQNIQSHDEYTSFGQNVSENLNYQTLNNTYQSNNDGSFKPSHKKNLSNHLINKLGAICKAATEGSQQFTQSSQNNSQNKDSYSFNNNQNNIRSYEENQNLNTVDKKERFQDNLGEKAKYIPSLQEDSEFYFTNCVQQEQENLKQQLLNFSERNIINEDIDYKIQDMMKQELDYLPNPDYFENQSEITCMMRCILFDWMFEVCMELMLKRDTLYLSLNYVDRFLSLSKVTKQNLQLVGAVSLFMACKIEEIYPPPINEFAKCTDDGYTVAQIVEHELLMLKVFDWKLNPPTQIIWFNLYSEIWDRFVKTSFEKPNKFQVNFVQDQKLSNKKYMVFYRIPDQNSYMLYREMAQLLDLIQLDVNVLRFEYRMLIASLMYLQLGICYKQFTKKQVHTTFNEKYLFANSLNNFNEFYNSFLTQNFNFNLIDLLSTLQYTSSFFDVEYNYSLSPAANIKDPLNNEISYEEYLSYQTYFPNGIEYMRKRYCS